METNHTPGPWIVTHRNPEDNTICIDAKHSYAIARVAPKPFYRFGEQDANAQLIAAAPNLLTASKDALESLLRLPNAEGAYRVTNISQLRIAIAKAEEK